MAFPNSIANNSNITSGEYNFTGSLQGWPAEVFADGSANRFSALWDQSNFTIGMWKSTNTGTTWAEIDGANRIHQLGTTNPDFSYHGNNTVLDTAHRELWVTYWSTNSTIATRPFDMANGTWGAAIVSTLTDASVAQNFGTHTDIQPESNSFITAFRPNDSAVWCGFLRNGDYSEPRTGTVTSTGDTEKVLIAKCLTTGAGWDATLTTLAGTFRDGYRYRPEAMVTDTAGNVNIFYSHTLEGVDAYGHYTVDGNGFITALTVDSGGRGYSPSVGTLTSTNGNSIGLFYVGLHSEFNDPGPFIKPWVIGTNTYVNNITLTIISEVVSSVSLSALGTVAFPNGSMGTATHFWFAPSTSTTTLCQKQMNTSNVLSAEQVIVQSTFGPGFLSRPVCSTANVISFTYSPYKTGTHANELHSIRGTAGVAPTWEDLDITAADTAMSSQGSISNADTMTMSGIDYVIYGYFNAAQTTCTYVYSTSPGIGNPWGPANTLGTIVQGATFSFPDTFALFNPQGNIGMGMGYGTNFGMAYWEVAPAPPGAVRIFFQPQYIKRHNAPGH